MTFENSSISSKTAVLVFSKVPKLNFVKTRLQSSVLTTSDILELYTGFLNDTIHHASQSSVDTVMFSVAGLEGQSISHFINTDDGQFTILPKAELKYIPQELSPHVYETIHVQQEGSFGDRMKNAIQWCFSEGMEKLVILGADSPQLQPSVINHSLKLLDSFDVIIGPSPVGGIYLIGVSADFVLVDFENVFTGVEMTNLAKLIKNNDLSGYILPELTDIDIEEDLIGLISWMESIQYLSPQQNLQLPLYTQRVIDHLKLTIQIDENDNRKKKISKATG